MIPEIRFSKNDLQAKQMAAYMKNQFPFAGVPAPERKALCKPLLKASKQLSLAELYQLVETYYKKDEREYQYLAMELAIYNVKRMNIEELLQYKKFVVEKAWWDSVDTWRKLFNVWSKQHVEEMPQVYHAFYRDSNFWNRRVAITLQLSFKELTDQELLKKAILYDQQTEEFFIQKAIGWALRDYSKSHPEWVQQFIDTTTLSSLAVREGSKYLPK